MPEKYRAPRAEEMAIGAKLHLERQNMYSRKYALNGTTMHLPLECRWSKLRVLYEIN